jgi:hypothetical protein
METLNPQGDRIVKFEQQMIEREKLSQLKRIALLLVTRMLAKMHQISKDIEAIVTVELLIEKREECKKIIDISKELVDWPAGEDPYEAKKLPAVFAQQPKLIAFRTNTDQLLWEIISKLSVLRDFLVISDSLPKCITISYTLNRIKKILFTDPNEPLYPQRRPTFQYVEPPSTASTNNIENNTNDTNNNNNVRDRSFTTPYNNHQPDSSWIVASASKDDSSSPPGSVNIGSPKLTKRPSVKSPRGRIKAKDIRKPELLQDDVDGDPQKWDQIFQSPVIDGKAMLRSSSRKRNELDNMIGKKTETLTQEMRDRVLHNMISRPELFRNTSSPSPNPRLSKIELDKEMLNQTLVAICEGYPVDFGNALLTCLPYNEPERKLKKWHSSPEEAHRPEKGHLMPFRILNKDLDYTYFAHEFKDNMHFNYISNDEIGPAILSISVAPIKDNGDQCQMFALLRTDKVTEHIRPLQLFPMKELKDDSKDWLKKFIKLRKDLVGVHFTQVKDNELDRKLLEFENNEISTEYKFGLLYVKDGQTTENEYYGNTQLSEDYHEFLNFVGETVTLKGWDKYDGELDTRNNTTGTQSLYTSWYDYEVMFHTATMLPFSTVDEQQIERKRFIGNDIVVLIFNDGNTHFDPSQMHSHFNHVFVVVQVDKETKKRTGKTCYKIAVVTKEGVPAFPPDFPRHYCFEKGTEFRDFLFSKLINSERAAVTGHPIFSRKIQRTRRDILSNLIQPYMKKRASKAK